MVAPAPRAVGVARVSRVGLKVQVVVRLGSGWRGVARREVVSFLAMDFRRRGDGYIRIHTIMYSSSLPVVSYPRAERSVRFRVRATHCSSWAFASASTAGIHTDCGGLGTSKRADSVCTCMGEVGLGVWGDAKGGGSSAPSPTASVGTNERFCHKYRHAQVE